MRAPEKTNLHSVPYDILYHIIDEIDLSDFSNLSKANRTLYNLLQNDLLAKRNIKRHGRYSKEAKLAFAGKITFRQAIGRLHDTRQAVATAKPYSVAVLAYASTFIYGDGVLSYVTNNEIRVLNVHKADTQEQVVDVQHTLRRIIPAFPQYEAEGCTTQLSFLYYFSGILAILVEIGETNAWLILLDITPGGSKQPKGCKPGRLRFVTRLECTRRLFVRHNGIHLYYGVNSIVDASGELLWAVHWADLTKVNRTGATKRTILDKVAGTDLGHNICFEIFNNHLYAVSNTIDSEEEALNWRSFYEWVCIPPDCNRRRVPAKRLWRRDHLEGPINDTWTEISLRQDEASGKPMILECRREWREGGSDHVRTYYAQPLPPVPAPNEAEPAVAPRATPQSAPSSSLGHPHPAGGTLPNYIHYSSLPLNGPTKEDLERHRRPGQHVHSEYTASCSPKRDFILAKTKYRTYHLSACAFLDLVNDPEPNNRVGVATDRVRLRINARKRKRIDTNDDDANICPSAKRRVCDDKSQIDEVAAVPPDGQHHASDGVLLWPPDNADEELINLLCPSRRATNIHAIADERSLIYSVDTDDPQKQAIILISFDPQIRLPCMRSRSEEAAAAAAAEATKNSSAAAAGIGLLGPENNIKSTQKFSVVSSSPGMPPSKPSSSVRTERAMHLSIDKGYWFDRER